MGSCQEYMQVEQQQLSFVGHNARPLCPVFGERSMDTIIPRFERYIQCPDWLP